MKRFCSYLFDPLRVITTNKADFFILIAFTVIFGQFGIIVNFILRLFLTSNTFQQSMYLESNSGSFYTFAIALVASCLSPIVTNFLDKEKLKFSSIKVVTTVLAFIFLFFSGIIYATTQVKQLQPLKFVNFSIDWPQITVYFIAMVFMVYSYCIMKIDYPKFRHLENESFDKEDDERVKSTMNESVAIKDDGTGVAL